MTRDLFSTRSLLISNFRNTVLEASTSTRMFLEPPTDRPHRSLTILLQLTMQCAPPSTLGSLQLPSGPHRKSSSGHKSGRLNPALSNKDDANTGTAHTLKTYLKDMDAAHQEGLYQRIHLRTRLSGPRIGLLHLAFGPASDEVTLPKQRAWDTS